MTAAEPSASFTTNPDEEVQWGWVYREKTKRERESRKLPTKKESVDLKCLIEKFKQKLACPAKCKNKSKTKAPKKPKKIGVLERSTMSKKQYWDMLSTPHQPVQKIDEKCAKKTCNLMPCPPRIVLMSMPPKRALWETWKNYHNVLSPQTILRIDDMLHTEQNVNPQQASVYFKCADRKKRRKRMLKKLKKLKAKKKKLRAKKEWVVKQIEKITCAILLYIHDAPYFDLNYKQYLFSTGILNRLHETKQLPKIDRNTKNPYKKTLIEISDKTAVWVDALMRFVENQYVESDSDVPEAEESEFTSTVETTIEEEEEGEEEGEMESEVIEKEEEEEEGEELPLFEQEEEEVEFFEGEDQLPLFSDDEGGEGGGDTTDYEDTGLSFMAEEDEGDYEGADAEGDEEGYEAEETEEEEEQEDEGQEDVLEEEQAAVNLEEEVLDTIVETATDVEEAPEAVNESEPPEGAGEEPQPPAAEPPTKKPTTAKKPPRKPQAGGDTDDEEKALEIYDEAEGGIGLGLEGPVSEEPMDVDVLYEKCGIPGEIKSHKPVKVLEHQPGTICCLSLKIWAVWLIEITHNAHNWTMWMGETIRKVRNYASIVRGEVKDESGDTAMLYKADWRKFCRETKASINKWNEYSKHVQQLNQEISDEFKDKRVVCCPKCLQDNAIKNVVAAHKTFKALTDAMDNAAFWHCNLEELIDKATPLSEAAADECREYEMDDAMPSIVDFQEVFQNICQDERPSVGSIYILEELDVPGAASTKTESKIKPKKGKGKKESKKGKEKGKKRVSIDEKPQKPAEVPVPPKDPPCPPRASTSLGQTEGERRWSDGARVHKKPCTCRKQKRSATAPAETENVSRFVNKPKECPVTCKKKRK